MGAAVGLGNVVGETLHLFVVGVVPLHGDFDGQFGADAAGIDAAGAGGVKDAGVQAGFGAVDVFDEAFHAAGEGEVFFLAGALVEQADFDAVVEEGKFAQAVGEGVEVVFDVAENFFVGEEMHFGAAPVALTQYAHRAHFDAVDDLCGGVVRHATVKFEEVGLTIAADGQPQPLRERIDAGHAHAVQTARDLVAVLVELAAGVQYAHDDFGSGTARFVFVVHLDADGNAATIVGYRDRVVGVDGNEDVVAVAGKGFVNGVVDDFKDHVVQAGAVGGVADVHAGALAHGFQPFELLDAGFVVFVRLVRLLFAHGDSLRGGRRGGGTAA